MWLCMCSGCGELCERVDEAAAMLWRHIGGLNLVHASGHQNSPNVIVSGASAATNNTVCCYSQVPWPAALRGCAGSRVPLP